MVRRYNETVSKAQRPDLTRQDAPRVLGEPTEKVSYDGGAESWGYEVDKGLGVWFQFNPDGTCGGWTVSGTKDYGYELFRRR